MPTNRHTHMYVIQSSRCIKHKIGHRCSRTNEAQAVKVVCVMFFYFFDIWFGIFLLVLMFSSIQSTILSRFHHSLRACAFLFFSIAGQVQYKRKSISLFSLQNGSYTWFLIYLTFHHRFLLTQNQLSKGWGQGDRDRGRAEAGAGYTVLICLGFGEGYH